MIGVGTTIFLVRPQTFASGASYLLDTYSAAAAYSLRQLKTGVTNVVRVRRSGDSAESDFTATDITDGSLASWVVAGGGTQDGYTVTWYDQSGNNDNQTQATAASQPQIVSAGSLLITNGKPYIEFDGSNDYLASSANTATSGFVFSAAFSKLGGVRPLLGQGDSTSGASFFAVEHLVNSGSKAPRILSNGADIVVASGVDNYLKQSLCTYSSNGSTWSMWVNGSSKTLSVSAGSNTGAWFGDVSNGSVTIGSLQDATPGYFDSCFHEILIFNSDETSNRVAIETDMNNEYSIY